MCIARQVVDEADRSWSRRARRSKAASPGSGRSRRYILSTELYYFSGTGNSLVVARDIARLLEARLTSIPSVMDNECAEPDADVLGIVSPAYYMRMPRIVESFAGKLTQLQGKYIFAVFTVGGIAGDVLDRLAEAIGRGGGHLAAGFVVRMPANYIHDADALPPFLQRRMFSKWDRRAEEIAEYVINGKTGRMERFNPVMTRLFSRRIERDYLSGALRPSIDEYFWADGKCDGCSICTRVCPVGNIELVADRPAWKHNCEKCLACIQWCPKEAIQFSDVTVQRKRYHHPEVTLAEMLRRNSTTAAR